MSTEKSDLYAAIIFISVAFFVIGVGLVYLVKLYYHRKKLYEQEKKLMSQKFEAELLKTHIEVQEQTMQTIAADLHDNIGQLLSLTMLTLGSIEIGEDEKSKRKITDSLSLVNKSIKELRELAKLLHGEQLIATGLGDAITQELNWLKKTGVYQLKIDNQLLDLQLSSPNKDLIILRLLQEIFNNIIKHAQATLLEFSVAVQDGKLLLRIAENGIGFDYEQTKIKKNGMGLSSILKRIELIDGQLTIHSLPKEGTTIHIEIPYP